MALRSIWNGTIAFAGVFVPIKVHSATEDRSIHFHEVHVDDGARIEHRRFCSKEDKEVSQKQIVKGYEVSEGTYVLLEDDVLAVGDLEALDDLLVGDLLVLLGAEAPVLDGRAVVEVDLAEGHALKGGSGQ